MKNYPFPEIIIQRDNVNRRYNTSLYRKPTNTNLYLLYEGNQCREYKLSVIRTLFIRIHLLCSTNELKTDEIHLMKTTLITKIILFIEGEIVSNRILKESSNFPSKKTTSCLIPYYGQQSMMLSNKYVENCYHLSELICVLKKHSQLKVYSYLCRKRKKRI